MQVIVFSRDRAMQLHALLESFSQCFPTIIPTVLFRASDRDYQRGYDLLMTRFGARWMPEGDFRQDLLNIVTEPVEGTGAVDTLTMFAVDDDVFKRKVSLKDIYAVMHDPRVLCLSLRLSPEITHCYTMDIDTPPPRFDDRIFARNKDRVLTWDWQGKPGDWGYPFSCDGHIYRTHQILPVMQRTPWATPNQMEGRVVAAGDWKLWQKMACFSEQVVVNIPANLVQTDFQNRTCGGLSSEVLNNRYLHNEIIDIWPLVKQWSPACHLPMQYDFKNYHP